MFDFFHGQAGHVQAFGALLAVSPNVRLGTCILSSSKAIPGIRQHPAQCLSCFASRRYRLGQRLLLTGVASRDGTLSCRTGAGCPHGAHLSCQCLTQLGLTALHGQDSFGRGTETRKRRGIVQALHHCTSTSSTFFGFMLS